MPPLKASEAIELILSKTKLLDSIAVPLSSTEVYGMVLAEDIFADRDQPPFNRAAVDGYAVRYEDLKKGVKSFHVTGTLRAGSGESFQAKEGTSIRVMTGAPVPAGFDVMIKVEESKQTGEVVSFDSYDHKQWLNIALKGEDAKEGSVIIKKGTRIDNAVIPLLASTGKTEFLVYRRPTVALITTGDEVIPPEEKPLPYQIRDTSSYSIHMLLSYYGISLSKRIRVKDNDAEVRRAMKEGLEHDILLITGGVSMGDTDRIPDLLMECGVEKGFHKAKVKPGKPIFFGTHTKGVVFGLPGNPVSSQMGFKMFAEPSIRKMMGLTPSRPMYLPLGHDKVKKHELEEFAQVYLEHSPEGSVMMARKHHGSGDFVNLSVTDGVMVHPADTLELKKGSIAAFFPWRHFY